MRVIVVLKEGKDAEKKEIHRQRKNWSVRECIYI